MEELRNTYGILDNGCPSEPNLFRMEKHIDRGSLRGSILSLRPLSSMKMLRITAKPAGGGTIDGKYMHGTLLANGRSPDIVSLFDADSGIAQGTEMCEEKRNEIRPPRLLERVTLPKNAVVTADAMNCQTDIIRLIVKVEQITSWP